MSFFFFFFSSRRRHTRYIGDWSSDVCSSDLYISRISVDGKSVLDVGTASGTENPEPVSHWLARADRPENDYSLDRKSTRLNSSHRCISYAVFCLKKKKKYRARNNTNRS